MMRDIRAAWHRASYDRCTHDTLPALLAARLPLTGYHVEEDDTSCRLTVMLADAEAAYTLPRPDADGIFQQFDHPRVVVPLASSESLATAEIACVGEQLLALVEDRLGDIAADLPWDEGLIRAVLPLEEWVAEVLTGDHHRDGDLRATGQPLDTSNRLATIGHLRRIVVPERERVVTPDHFGRVCPFETPEGPNLGHVCSLARGAAIREGRLVIEEESPVAALGVSAAMVPFLEHDDPLRLTFGVNMLRQWITPLAPEPALVRTGYEPNVPGIWCGYNLLTALVAWGADTYEDAILLSASCAQRLQYATPVEPGDKWSTRHGIKGIISRIVPDADMPHLADGTPVELAYSFAGIFSRLTMGMTREAVMSRIARAEGEAAVVPPFAAPSAEELRARLAAAGLPEDGMETLYRDGTPLPFRATIGWIYWGRTRHIALDKIHAGTRPGDRLNRQGELEYYALRDVGAVQTIIETFNTRAADRPDAATFADRVTAGPVPQAAPPTPRFLELVRRLAAVGIDARFTGDRVTFRFAPVEGLRLARPVPHPWMREREITAVGEIADLPTWTEVADANARLARLLEKGAPSSLVQTAHTRLAAAVHAYGTQLLPADYLRPGARVLFSGRSVLAPAVGLRLDQVGVPEEMAWTLFGPRAARAVGGAAVAARTPAAARALDAALAGAWIVLNRAPTIMPTALLAFRPVRAPGRAIRLHPLACMLTNADYDGDQAALFLPVTEEGQREAAERLSVAGHLRRDPSLIRWLVPYHQALFGLAWLSLTAAGKAEIAACLGRAVEMPEGYITRAGLTQALSAVLAHDGADAALAAAERLLARGLDASAASGASLSPFFAGALALPTAPASDDPAAWHEYADVVTERLAASNEFTAPDLGPALLAVKCGARGSIAALQRLVGPIGPVTTLDGETLIVRHGYREGLTPAELFALVPGAREALARVLEATRRGYGVRDAASSSAFTVLARAQRAAHPGLVFAAAAATEETDPLRDRDSRLFVGLR